MEIEDIFFRPPGRPSRKPLVRYKSFRYQAESWATPRRIVAKVEHHQGELFPRVGFIVTNMALPSRSLVRFYNKRGTAEQWIKEGKQATHGRGCRAIVSGRTKFGSSSPCWPTTWATSGADWSCRMAKKRHKCGAVFEKCPESSGSSRLHVSAG